MEQQRIIFESSPAYILVCLAVGVGYALLLYRTTHPWPVLINRVLFGMRAVLAFLLAFLLLGPIIRQITNFTEKPLFVILRDNSGSVIEATDSVTRVAVADELRVLSESLEDKGYEVAFTDLDGRETAEPEFNARVTDLHGALEHVTNRYEGKKFGGVLLVSDGIYNKGISPLFANYKFPDHTLGIGDTTQRTDVPIRNVAFNKLTYQGNKFPIRVEVILKGLDNQRLTVTLQHKGRTIDQQTKDTGDDTFITYDFQVQADEQGIQKYDLAVDVVTGETNVRNNRATIFVEVVEGKKKIVDDLLFSLYHLYKNGCPVVAHIRFARNNVYGKIILLNALLIGLHLEVVCDKSIVPGILGLLIDRPSLMLQRDSQPLVIEAFQNDFYPNGKLVALIGQFVKCHVANGHVGTLCSIADAQGMIRKLVVREQR